MIEKLTIGHLNRHSPANTSAGLEAAIIDVAQDFLLTHLAEIGILDNLAIKGGTALRKFVAGNSGRFSTDLDFALASPDISISEVQGQLIDAISNYSNDYFRYKVSEHRGKLTIKYETDFLDTFLLSTKVDIAPPTWIKPTLQTWKSLPIHSQYGFNLPRIKVVDLLENMSEKLARFNRTALARDMYDLVWLATTSPYSTFDKSHLRHLTLLKLWTDQFGISNTTNAWGNSLNAKPFDVLRFETGIDSKTVDDEQIGLLTTPQSSMRKLVVDFHKNFRFIANVNNADKLLINGNRSVSREVITDIQALKDANLSNIVLW